MKRLLLLTAPLLLLSSCAFHSNSTHWNSRVGPNGQPVFVKSSTAVGMNFLIVLGLFGSTDLPTVLDDNTSEIAIEGGDKVRVIQSSSENYWYGFPPFTWIFTPVVTTVVTEYEPTEAALAEVARELAEEAEE